MSDRLSELIFLLIPTQLPLIVNLLAMILNLADWWQNERRFLPLISAIGAAGVAGVYMWFLIADPAPVEAQPFFRLANLVLYTIPLATAWGNLRAYRAAGQIKALIIRVENLEKENE